MHQKVLDVGYFQVKIVFGYTPVREWRVKMVGTSKDGEENIQKERNGKKKGFNLNATPF